MKGDMLEITSHTNFDQNRSIYFGCATLHDRHTTSEKCNISGHTKVSFLITANDLQSSCLPEDDCALTSAPWAIRSLTMSTKPADAASINGVQSPLIPLSSTFACMANNT